jgi:hypothetical protein
MLIQSFSNRGEDISRSRENGTIDERSLLEREKKEGVPAAAEQLKATEDFDVWRPPRTIRVRIASTLHPGCGHGN